MKRQTMIMGCAALALAGCQQGPRTTIDLLRDGDSGVCIAKDVEDTLRQMIRPAGSAAAGYTIAFADTSLEAVDKSVGRATCNTALTVEGPDGPVIERTMLDYVITPAAQNPATFLVSGSTEPLRRRLQAVIEDAANARAQEENMERQQEALAALIKPGWLIGRWVEERQGSQACINGPYDDYGRGQRYTNGLMQGRWKLEGQGLTIIGPTASALLSITDATMDSFTIDGDADTSRDYRRCTRDELQPVGQPTSDGLTDDLRQAEAAIEPRGE